MVMVSERVHNEEDQIIWKILKFHLIPSPSVIYRKYGSHNFPASDNSVSQHQLMISRQLILAYIQSR
jgi:hypothetical protein